MDTRECILPEVVEHMRTDMADAVDGVGGPLEILWVGRCDEDGLIAEVLAAARGTAEMVPALFPHMVRGDVVIHNHPGGDLRPSGADLQVASRLGNQGIGFFIVDSRIERVHIVAAPVPRKEIVLLDTDTLTGILEPDGALERRLEGYEARPGQIDMLRMTVDAFNEGCPMIAEAGTGIGKSFAYLLPALKWASENDERIVVSTATIALQQQLVDKDIPLVKDVLGIDTKIALVKGRGNYLCLKRLEEASNEDELFGSGDALERIRAWAEATSTGAKSDIPFKPDDSDWSMIRCEADSCTLTYCRHFEKCFLIKARRAAAEASVLVANHHLLFADLSARLDGVGPDETVVLPPYGRIVFDEAHHAETSATDLFSTALSLPGVNRVFRRLHHKKGSGHSGLLDRLAVKCPDTSEVFLGTLPPLIDAARARAETMDALGRDLLAGERQRRLSGEPCTEEQKRLLDPLEKLRASLGDLAGRFAESIRDLDSDGSDPEIEGLLMEARQAISGLQEAASVADSFLHRDEHPEKVFWLESLRRSDGGEWLACNVTPLSVASLVREAVWEPYGTVVCVSATMAVGGRFNHWKSRLGADRIPHRTLEGLFPSPFDFASRVLLGVPSDVPSPEENEAWELFLVHAISKALLLTGGHALVLFTSYETLKRTLRGVRAAMGDVSPVILAQGDDDRGRLLKSFRDNPSSILFATDSFWEGVDVPGDSLKLVVITRLPFRPPSNPVAQARRDAISAAGGNPFLQLTLPEAIMRFRQGFGRLMRRSDDRGSVLVLDSRIIRKQYGPLFLESLPLTVRSIKSFEGVMREMEDFLYS